MNNTRRLGQLALVLVLVLLAFPAATVCAEQTRLSAELSGSQEVPPVHTEARGDLKLNIYEHAVSFELSVTGLMNARAAQIHLGRPGENGPPIAGLFGGPTKEGKFSGVLAEGTITRESLLGELQGKRVADLVRLLRSGRTYLNILTDTFPDGEIRGQIK